MPLVKKPEPPRPKNNGQPARPETLAVNVFDLTRLDSNVRAMLLGGKLELDREKAIRVDPDRLDETAVILTCDLLTAGAVLDVIRDHDRRGGDCPTRVYLRRVKAWERLPADALLTCVRGNAEVVELHPRVFPPVAVVASSHKKAERLF